MTEDFKKEIFQLLKESFSEKIIAEHLLSLGKQERKITKIGHVNDIDSDHKNDFFEEIYKDENEKIIDIRLSEKEPSQKELEEMSEYWLALQKHFKRRVEPVFIITGETLIQN